MSSAADEGSDEARGVLGRLPRSRPGQRSDKRGGGAAAGARGSGASDGARGRAAGEGEGKDGRDRARPPTRPSRGAAAQPRPPAGGARQAPAERTPASSENSRGPVGEAAHVAGRAARLGLGVAGGVLKRLPRP
jgi:hypothetical protein